MHFFELQPLVKRADFNVYLRSIGIAEVATKFASVTAAAGCDACSVFGKLAKVVGVAASQGFTLRDGFHDDKPPSTA